MKRKAVVLFILIILLVLTACATREPSGDVTETESVDIGNTLYVIAPSAEADGTGQLFACAESKCAEINGIGIYSAVCMTADTDEELNARCEEIITNADAALVILTVTDCHEPTCIETLKAAGIPCVCTGIFAPSADSGAVLNVTGDERQCGACAAHYMQENGMKPGDTVVTVFGDDGELCRQRAEGFAGFLSGKLKCSENGGEQFETAEKWDEKAIDDALYDFSIMCDWSVDGACNFMDQELTDMVAAAKKSGGRMFIFSMDDAMTLGILNYIETASEELLADLEKLNVFVATVGENEELPGLTEDAEKYPELAGKYFDGMLKIYMPEPELFAEAIDRAVGYLDGEAAKDGETVCMLYSASLRDKTHIR